MSISARLGILVTVWLLTGGPCPTGPSIGWSEARAQQQQQPSNVSVLSIRDTRDRKGQPSRFASLDVERLPRLPSRLPPFPVASHFVASGEISRVETMRVEAVSQADSLAQAWAIALAVDQALEAKRWYALAANFSRRSAEAERYPTMKVESSFTGQTDYQAFKVRTGSASEPSFVFPYMQNEYAAFRCGMELPLFTSGAIQHGIDAAEANVSSAELEAQRSAKDLKMRVAEEYVAVLRSQRDLEATETTAQSLASHAADVAKLFEHGQVPRNDLLAAQVALSNAKQEVIRTRYNLDASRSAYNRRMGRPLTAIVRIKNLSIMPTQGTLAHLTSQALQTRREPARIAAQIHALRHQAAYFRSQNGLQVNLRGEYAYEENRFRIPQGIGLLSVGASWNLFDGGRNQYQAAALEHRADGLVHVKNDLETQIALEVRKAWLDVQETGRRRIVASKAIQRAEENLRVASRRYKAGLAISTEVLHAESLRAQAYQNYDHANCDAILAALRVHHAAGQL